MDLVTLTISTAPGQSMMATAINAPAMMMAVGCVMAFTPSFSTSATSS
jgi:hypothetical protein